MKEINDRNKYTQLWKKTKLGINQSWEWAEKRKSTQTILRYVDEGIPITIYIKQIPGIKTKYGYIPRGLSKEYIEMGNLKNIASFAKSNRLSHIIVEPEVQYKQTLVDSAKNAGLKVSGKTIQPDHTHVTEVNFDDEQLLMNMKARHRQNVRRAIKQGVEVEVDNSNKGFEDFYSVMLSIFERTNYVMYNKQYFVDIYEEFKDSEAMNIFIAKKDDKVLGALFTIDNGYMMYEWSGGVNLDGRKSEAGYLLKYAAFKHARDLGISKYDHWGTAPLLNNEEFDNKHPMYEISKYKKGFGGETIRFLPQLTFVVNQLPYTLFKVGLTVHKKMISMKKR